MIRFNLKLYIVFSAILLSFGIVANLCERAFKETNDHQFGALNKSNPILTIGHFQNRSDVVQNTEFKTNTLPENHSVRKINDRYYLVKSGHTSILFYGDKKLIEFGKGHVQFANKYVVSFFPHIFFCDIQLYYCWILFHYINMFVLFYKIMKRIFTNFIKFSIH